ncbi:hypothetical protein CCR75_005392 [Bremia lactucae]|uniref:Uncharacterized protein n=1 Tax=Bremia lactucae TaxID=4779 RepID=A0A976FLB6_BRELC|nr:hypothetical protein CCR75_005392 [Bremia lactucae]
MDGKDAAERFDEVGNVLPMGTEELSKLQEGAAPVPVEAMWSVQAADKLTALFIQSSSCSSPIVDLVHKTEETLLNQSRPLTGNQC